MTVVKFVSQSKIEKSLVAFGFTDNKGRPLGAIVARFTEEFAALDGTEVYGSFWKSEPGVYTTVRVETARGGKEFGAGQRGQRFPIGTPESKIESYINKRIAETRKRYEKKFLGQSA